MDIQIFRCLVSNVFPFQFHLGILIHFSILKMTKRDFFVLLVKCLGVYFLINLFTSPSLVSFILSGSNELPIPAKLFSLLVLGAVFYILISHDRTQKNKFKFFEMRENILYWYSMQYWVSLRPKLNGECLSFLSSL